MSVNENSLAPVGFTVYKRIEHLEKSVAALKNNDLAADTDLFFFSDMAKPGDEEKVKQVREFIKEVSGFKSVTVTERAENSRVKNNRGGLSYLTKTYGKVIWMAEDIVTAPGFLNFMNGALNSYKDDRRVFSIAGWSPPIELPGDYTKDCFLLPRFNGWGFAIWEDRFQSAAHYMWNKIPVKEYKSTIENKRKLRKLVSLMGEDYLKMLYNEMNKPGMDALDLRYMFHQYQHNLYTVYPSASLVQNTGHDGSGLHCGVTNRFDVTLDLNKKDFIFPKNIKPEDRIILANAIFRSFGNKELVQSGDSGLLGKIKDFFRGRGELQ